MGSQAVQQQAAGFGGKSVKWKMHKLQLFGAKPVTLGFQYKCTLFSIIVMYVKKILNHLVMFLYLTLGHTVTDIKTVTCPPMPI